jgi:hypothetical protein
MGKQKQLEMGGILSLSERHKSLDSQKAKMDGVDFKLCKETNLCLVALHFWNPFSSIPCVFRKSLIITIYFILKECILGVRKIKNKN